MRKCYIFIICFVIMLSFTSCGTIEDTNGEEDKSLAVITDYKLSQSISGSISVGNSRKSGSQSIYRASDGTNLSDDEYDFDNIEFSFTRLNGTQKAMITYLKKGQKLTIKISSNISKGNFTGVLLDPDKVILKKIAADEDAVISITAEIEGDYKFIIAGESAEGSIKINRTYE